MTNVNKNWIRLKSTVEMGNISRGKKIFVARFELSIIEPAPMESEEHKNVHGKKPHRKNIAKLSTLILITYLKATVYTISINNGESNDHRKPKTEPLYLIFKSLAVKV